MHAAEPTVASRQGGIPEISVLDHSLPVVALTALAAILGLMVRRRVFNFDVGSVRQNWIVTKRL